MSQKYTSFKLLDEELEIARLQKDIDIQLLKNKILTLKEASSEVIKPKNMVSGIAQQIGSSIIHYRGSILQMFVVYAIKRLLRKRIK